MTEDLKIQQDITRDLLERIASPSPTVREGAVEALAVSTEDEDWRPDDLIEQGGIEPVASLLRDKKAHIVLSALDIIIATAAAGGAEALIDGGVIDRLDQMQDHKDPLVQKKVREALGLLVPHLDEEDIPRAGDDFEL